MTRGRAAGLAVGPVVSPIEFFAVDAAFVSPARVVGWPQEPTAVATRRAPSGYRQGGRWGSTT